MRIRWVILLVMCCHLLAGCQRAGPVLRIERPLVSSVEPLALPAAWRAEYASALQTLGIAGPALAEHDGAEQVASAVREGRARFALTTAGASGELVAQPVGRTPVALVIPLTFPVEEVTAQQARDLAAGRVRDWRALAGPPGAVTATLAAGAHPGLAGRVLGVDLGSLPASAAGVVPRGGVRFDTAGGPLLGEKALRVDGRLPDDPGYPLAEDVALVSRPEDAVEASALAAQIIREQSVRRRRPVVLDAVGDIMLGRSLTPLMAERGATYPLAAVQPVMAAADIRFGNLELALTDRGTPARKDYVFRAPPERSVEALRAGGFNLLSLANNHLTDYGNEGVTDTLQALRAAGIVFAGAGQDATEAHTPAVITVRGVRLALLAYVNVPDDSRSGFKAQSMAAAPGRPGVAWGTPEVVRRDVAAAKTRADLVIVSLHTGYEYTATPNGIQRELSRAAVESGAALVLGGHPHVLQGVEYYRGVPVIHSLGNFVFDLDDDDRRQPGLPSVLSVIFRVTLDRQGVRNVQFIPVIIDEREGRPLPATGAEAQRVRERLYRLTDTLATGP